MSLDVGSRNYYVNHAYNTQQPRDPAAADDPQLQQASSASFAEQARGTTPQPVLDRDLALLSQDVYNAESTDPIGSGGWTRVSDAELEAAGVITPRSDAKTGFQSAVYTNGDGSYVVAYAGTDPTNIQDWLTNGGQGLGFETSQYSDAMTLAMEVDAAWPGQTVITGHSLGGGLASAAALASDSPAVTFNAAGVSDQTVRDLGFTPSGARELAADGLIRRYSVENDVLTGAQSGLMPLPEALGAQLQLENTYRIKDPIRAHQMNAVLRGLDAGDPTPVERSPAIDALARPGEVGFDLLTDAVRETVNLGGDIVGAGGEVVSGLRDAGQDLRQGRPVAAAAGLTGDVADAGLQVAGDAVDFGLSTAGDVVQGGGALVGGWARDLGGLVGLDGAGNAVGGWVEGAGEWAGNKLDQAGSWVSEKLDTAGDWVNSALDTAGNWVSDRVRDAGGWVSDRARDVGDWAGDRWNDVKESKLNPSNWF